jgi:hypothetical protein
MAHRAMGRDTSGKAATSISTPSEQGEVGILVLRAAIGRYLNNMPSGTIFQTVDDRHASGAKSLDVPAARVAWLKNRAM